jgi:hypothetical protein
MYEDILSKRHAVQKEDPTNRFLRGLSAEERYSIAKCIADDNSKDLIKGNP